MRVLVLLALAVGFATDEANSKALEWYEAKYDSIYEPDLDSCTALDVSDLEFEIDTARFILESGTVYFFPSVDAQVYGCVFSGNGRLLLDPPTPVERFSLKKHFDKESLDLEFSYLRMMGSPQLLAGYFNIASAKPSKAPGKARGFIMKCKRAAKNEDNNIEASVLGEIAGQAGSFIWADIDSEKGRVAVAYNTYVTESFRVFMWTSSVHGDYYELVLSAYPKEHYRSGKSWKHRDPVITVEPFKYTIDSEISERAHLTCRARLDFVSAIDSLVSLFALMHYKTDIDSVFTADGRQLFFSKMKEEPGFWIYFDEPVFDGDTLSLDIFYRSKEIISKSPWGIFFISGHTWWYPNLEPGFAALYDASFRCHKDLTVLAVGDKVADSVLGDDRISRWVTSQPEVFTSFNYGLFDTASLSHENLPTVRVFRSKSHRASAFGEDMRENVGLDVLGALRLFSGLYGEMPYDTIYVTEIPTHGEGAPGLIHLSWETFQSELAVWDSKFRAHEVAHQWWGCTVQFESYHDLWLQEALADFSGALYVQARCERDKEYFEIVKRWREGLLSKGGASWLGTEAGPVWLGWRLDTAKSEDFEKLVYRKGPLIIHMLRCLMKDWTTDSDQRFIDMIRDFAKTHYRKPAATSDFQRMVEKYVGEPMDWFFDQWVYGIHIPELKFKDKMREENGEYFVDVEIVQKKVPDDFKSIIPIRIEFSDDLWTVVTVTAVGNRTQVTLPPLPYKPRNLDFNYYMAVLER